MKKKLLCVLLCLMMALTLLPMSALAAPTMLKSVDVSIELPKGGDPFDQSFLPTVTSFKSGSIDLLATGAGVLDANWRGDYDTAEDGTPLFRAGGTYYLTLHLMFNIDAGYCANYKMSNGEYLVGPDTFSATVNGMTATVRRNGPPYYPTVEISLTLEGEALSDEEKAERSEEWEALTQTRRAMYTPRTRAEADTYARDKLPEKVVVVNTDGTDLNYDFEKMTTIVMDVSNAEQMTDYLAHKSTLKEIWLGAASDPYKFVGRMGRSLWNNTAGMYYYEQRSDIPMYTAESTLFIPESKASALIKDLAESGVNTAFTIRTYSGNDVVAAQKAGASATKELCTTHKYTQQIRSADRIYTFDDGCQNARLYYYSCAYCGKCENNPKHVDYCHSLKAEELATIKLVQAAVMHGGYECGHSRYGIELPNDNAYIGVNAAGQHVWWHSCAICGNPCSYERLYPNTSDQKATGLTGMSFAEFQAAEKAELKKTEALALGSVDPYPDTFTLPMKSDAKMSSWAQSDVNLALNDDLLDAALLGNDYTKSISRLQFCSVAVKLAETLTGKSLPSAAANTFTDTSNPYVLKAYAAGITTGTGNGAFSPNGTLTRQEMATFLYRTLQYVEKNSDYSYTDYTSKLASYSDNAQVQSWAKESMAFMNALDLVKGTSATTLSPNGICTIEQAVAVAERSVYAHLIGWYQVEPHKTIYTDGQWQAQHDYAEIDLNTTLHQGDYVWVTGRRYGVYNNFTEIKQNLPYVYAPIINPFNGQAAEIKNGDIIPVRN